MVWQFKAENYSDAVDTFCRWMESGLVPCGAYDIRENPERDGYFVAEAV